MAYTITNITDIPLSSTASLLASEFGRTLTELSRVRIYANRETVDITMTATVGPDQVLQNAISAINAVVGSAPSTRDDLLVDTFGQAGAEIVIIGRNADVAAAREARVIVAVTPVDEDRMQQLMAEMGFG